MSEFKEKWEVIEGTINDFAKVKIGDRILELKSLGFSYLNVEKEKSISKLIACAPEMLESLQEMVRMYEEVQPAGGWQGVYESAKYAIKKATE